MFCWPGYNHIMENLDSFSGNYLEIGVFNGDSVKGIAENFPHKNVIGVDPFIEDGYTVNDTHVDKGNPIDRQHQNTLANIEGLENVFLNVMTSKEFSEGLTDSDIEKLNVSVILIDGSHWLEDVIIDIDLAMKLIGSKPGMIVFDDTNLPGVAEGYSKFLEDNKAIINKTVRLVNDNIWAVYINGENTQ